MADEERERQGRGAGEPAVQPEEVTAGNPYHLSRAMRTILRIVAAVLVVTMTALFLRGFVNQ